MAGICLVLGAVGATALVVPAGAMASLPEFGRCLPAAGKTGEYRGPRCSLHSTTPHTGAYEWSPGPGAKPKFEGVGEEVKLQTVGGKRVTCSASIFTGEYTGTKTETVKVNLVGCIEGTSKQNCQTVPLVEGEITSTELEGEIGYIKNGERPVVGLDMKPKAGNVLWSFSCGKFPEVAIAETVEGSVIVPVYPRGKMTELFKLNYAETAGKQAVQSFEGGAKDTLTTSFVKGTEVGSEETGFKSLSTETNEEPLEIKVV